MSFKSTPMLFGFKGPVDLVHLYFIFLCPEYVCMKYLPLIGKLKTINTDWIMESPLVLSFLYFRKKDTSSMKSWNHKNGNMKTIFITEYVKIMEVSLKKNPYTFWKKYILHVWKLKVISKRKIKTIIFRNWMCWICWNN